MSAKKINIHLRVLNVKLLSNQRRGDNAYQSIISDLKTSRIKVQTYSDYHMMLRTQFEKNGVIYGKILKFIELDDKWFNEETMEYQYVDIDGNLHPNTKETDYFFIPEAHRFCFSVKPGFSENLVKKFLENGLNKITSEDEEVQVYLEQDKDGFEQILNAYKVSRLSISISYSNNDLSDDFAKVLDNELRGTGVGKLDLEARPDINEKIDVPNSNFFKGALDLAQSNGNAKAVIYTENQERQVVSTSEYPLRIKGVTTEDEKHSYIKNLILNQFRRNRHE